MQCIEMIILHVQAPALELECGENTGNRQAKIEALAARKHAGFIIVLEGAPNLLFISRVPRLVVSQLSQTHLYFEIYFINDMQPTSLPARYRAA